MSSKEPTKKPAESKKKKTPTKSKKTPTSSKTKQGKETKTKKETKTAIPKEWIEASDSSELEKSKRRSLISALKRSISVKTPTSPRGTEPMNIVITLSPNKHADIIEYIEENIPAGGRAEWVRDSIRLKMRIERGVFGLNAGQETTRGTEETLQAVFGQFAEVMTKMMNNLREGQTATPQRLTPPREDMQIRPTPRRREPSVSGGPPKIKKIETAEGGEKVKEIKPERPSLDDAIGAIVVVE
ncbi:MAG: hypothetical protein K9W42_03445 [Candidatus Heimdallarchaeota archaeon]|nr:hypothetical protein [Candidatus Heimdallarchaeota archaeon]